MRKMALDSAGVARYTGRTFFSERGSYRLAGAKDGYVRLAVARDEALEALA